MTQSTSAVIASLLSVLALACADSDRAASDEPGGKNDQNATAKELSNGVPVTIEGHDGEPFLFRFDLPKGQTMVRVETTGPSTPEHLGGADLYLKLGAPPNPEDPEFADETGGNREHFELPPLSGTWFGMVTFDSDQEVELTATWNATEPGTRILENGKPVVFDEVHTFHDFLSYFEIPAGATNVKVSVTSEAGDPRICWGSLFARPQASNSLGDCDEGARQAELRLDTPGKWLVALSSTDSDAPVRNAKVVLTYDE